MACPEGLEPPTCCLEGSCSIRLSYGQRGPCGRGREDGRGEMIRTSDPLLPKQLRYQAALHPEGANCTQEATSGFCLSAERGPRRPAPRTSGKSFSRSPVLT